MLMKNEKKKKKKLTVRCRNYGALQIALFLIQKEKSENLKNLNLAGKVWVQDIGHLKCFRDSCIMDFSARHKIYSCACAAMNCIPIYCYLYWQVTLT